MQHIIKTWRNVASLILLSLGLGFLGCNTNSTQTNGSNTSSADSAKTTSSNIAPTGEGNRPAKTDSSTAKTPSTDTTAQ